ncbi:MAG: Flp pilus assembly complex ATPase component TadA [Coriobacteriia bacterium]|nr:Flp pilus assembly complex ATPase component TadA [Coriobacteriia bacterium]
MSYTREKMGELLVRLGLVTEAQLDSALVMQKANGGKIGEILVHQLVLTEDQIAEALASQKGLPHVNLAATEIDRSAVSLLPVRVARRRNIIPIGFNGDHLILAMSDPLDVEAIDETAIRTGYKIDPVVASSTQVLYAIEKYSMSSDVMQEFGAADVAEEESDEGEGIVVEGDVPVVRIVNQLIREAVMDNASDIHFEPQEHQLRIRYRIDGVLQDVANLPKSTQAGILSRVKVMADMDITERRRPQDGRIALKMDEMTLDMRVATLPTPNGEGIVIRVLNSGVSFHQLDDLGLSTHNRPILERMLARPYGAILIAGPTGSGKTTTLYASLNYVNLPTRKIVTVEDPIEYRMEGLTQVAVNTRIGLTFAAGLRTILRFDPDVVMVGEVRDAETASIAIRAALTGHLVLSSIHTNDAPSALTRLNDMGVESYVTSSALIGSIAQRLVRVLCPHCKKPVKASWDELVAVGFDNDEARSVQAYGPVGCEQCRKTGYKGRQAVFEIMEMDEDLTRLFIKNAPSEELRELAISKGMRTLRRDALDKVAEGITSLEEVARVVA